MTLYAHTTGRSLRMEAVQLRLTPGDTTTSGG